MDLVVARADTAARIDDVAAVGDASVGASDTHRAEQNPETELAGEFLEGRQDRVVLLLHDGRHEAAADQLAGR